MRSASDNFIITSLFFLGYFTLLFSQGPDTVWTRTYGGSGVDRLIGVIPTPDGGFMCAGVTPHAPSPEFDIWFFKTDGSGNILWEETIGRADSAESINSFESAWDGGFLMAGTMSNSAGNSDATMVKLYPDGQVEWWFRYGIISETTSFNGVVSIHSGGAIGTGWATLYNAGSNFYTVGAFPSGLYMWMNLRNWDYTDKGNHICQTADGGYIITGETNSFGAHSFGIFLQKLDESGLDEWFQLHSWEGDQYGKYVQQTPDQGYIVAGHSTRSGGLDDEVCLVKTDSLGNGEWFKLYGGGYMDQASCVQVVENGYIVAGTGQKSTHSRDMYILRLDWNGDTLWTKHIGNEWNTEAAYQIRQTSDGGYIIAGYRVIATGNSDAYLVRLATDSITAINSVHSEIPQDYIVQQNYPNPFNPATTIQFQLPCQARVALEIFDPLGKELETLIDAKLPAGSHEKIWQPQDLPSGIYFYQLKANDFQTVKKMILMH